MTAAVITTWNDQYQDQLDTVMGFANAILAGVISAEGQVGEEITTVLTGLATQKMAAAIEAWLGG